ncbi:MAG: hypothetical protein KTQ49_07605 [Candidatus Omnitrophica bacterium]|nr:hypothetical protein [Candidatus Omnitrophota bacterium]
MKTPTIVSMKDIRLSLAAIARRVEAGECFIVVRDSKPVFQIEPLSGSGSNAQRNLSFDDFTQKVDRVRDPGERAWTPDAVEGVIQEMYRERSSSDEASGTVKKNLRNRRAGRS